MMELVLAQNSNQQLFLGVDGGGTKCSMRLVDANNNILAEEKIEQSSNLQIRNGDAAYEAIVELSKKVFNKAGLDLIEFGANTYACFGMSGARIKSAKQAFAKRQFPFAKIDVCDDIEIAHIGAFLEKDGAVLIIGTGSAGLGIIKAQRYQVGGWGFFVGDDMSGAILGRELLRKSLLAHEGLINKTNLSKAVMARFDNSAEKLMAWSFNSNNNKPARPSEYGKFMPLLLDYYEKNDDLAKELLDFELKAIKKYINWFEQRNIEQIAIIGGFGIALLPLIKKQFGKIIVKAKSEPLNGAIIIAKRLFSKTKEQ